MYINEINFEDFSRDVVINMPEDTLKCVSIKEIPHLVIKGSIICTHFKYEKYEFNFSRQLSDNEEFISLSLFIKGYRDLAIQGYYEYLTKGITRIANSNSNMSVIDYIRHVENWYGH